MKILLTGAAGFIASHLAESLLADGFEVVGLDNFDDFYDPAVKEENLSRARDHQGFSLVRGDIRDSARLEDLPEDIETIVHIAAKAGVRPSILDPVAYYDVNVHGTLRLLEMARTRGIHRFLFASSSSVYGDNQRVPFSERDPVDHPISPYAATKRAGELLCHTYTHLHELTCLCLRLFTVYGPRQRPDLAIHRFARLLSQGEEIPLFGDGSSERDYTYVEDILSGIRGGLGWIQDNPGLHDIVNLGGSHPVALRDMARILGEELGIEPRIRHLPMQPGDVRRTYADIEKARRLWGYGPKWGFRDGVREFVAWFKGG
jgi:UDP-glucuronate 4-epimerase